MCSSQNTISGAVTIVADKIGDIHNCSMFRCSELNGRCAVVAATPTYISVIYYSNTKREFTIIQVIVKSILTNSRFYNDVIKL